MLLRLPIFIAILVGWLLVAQGHYAGEIETYGNFETMGVIVDVPAGVSPAQISEARCYVKNQGQWQPAHRLVQVGSQRWFATSLFFLKPNTAYQIKVELCDQAGKVMKTLETTGRTRKEPTLHKPRVTIFVSPQGKDSNAGTKDAPFRTLKKALGNVKPGTTVYLRQGVYHEGELSVGGSGTVNAPITVRAYENESVILDGSDPALLAAKNWRDEGNGIYSHAYRGKNFNASVEHRKTGKLTRMFPMIPSLDALQKRTLIGKSFKQLHVASAIFTDGKRAYITLPGAIGNYIIHVSRFTRGLVLEDRQYLTFHGLGFRHYGKGMFGAAAFLLNTSNTLWQNCRIYHCNTGLWVKKSSSNNTVQDCEFRDDLTNWSWRLVKNGEGGYHNYVETGLVYIESTYYGRGMVIRRNQISGVFDGAKIAPTSKIRGRTSETDFYQNRITDVGDDFIETDGIARNVRIFDNVMDRSLSGISLAQALDGPTFILYNIIANCGVCRATQEEGFEGYPFKTNGGPGHRIGSGSVFFYHNTAYSRDPAGRAMLVKTARWKKFTFRNNIWCGNGQGFAVWGKTISPIDFDYDNLFVAGKGPLMRIGGAQLTTLAELKKRGYLKNGLSINPQFMNAEKGDYTLTPTSPCIDRGVAIPGINDTRMKGKAADLGALEKR